MYLYLYLYLDSVYLYLYLPSKNHLYLYLYLPMEKLLYLYLQSFFCICPNPVKYQHITPQDFCETGLSGYFPQPKRLPGKAFYNTMSYRQGDTVQRSGDFQSKQGDMFNKYSL